MTLQFLRATLEGDRPGAAEALHATVPEDWPDDAPVQLWEFRAREGIAETWGACAVILRATGEMVGHAGFHLPPGNAEIDRWAPGGVEIGYTIFQAHRRRGYAREATLGLVEWASTQGVHAVLATTAVDNEASRGVLLACGFQHRGQVEGDEGTEDVWVREADFEERDEGGEGDGARR
jgi:RimJ/RimL family protein N-acetyltransferase